MKRPGQMALPRGRSGLSAIAITKRLDEVIVFISVEWQELVTQRHESKAYFDRHSIFLFPRVSLIRALILL